MEKKFELLPPTMPNFARFKKEAGLRQDGFKVDNGFDIANFTEKEANEYAELMRKTFLIHWVNRKGEKDSVEASAFSQNISKPNVNVCKVIDESRIKDLINYWEKIIYPYNEGNDQHRAIKSVLVHLENLCRDYSR